MKFTEAFKSLGYNLEVPRQDWSAESEHGVCITIWKQEMRTRNGAPWFDSKSHGGPLEEWIKKPGNTKRKRHLSKALLNSAAAVDVVILDGTPGEGYGDAHPWVSAQRGASWYVTSFEPDTGHFSVEAKPFEN